MTTFINVCEIRFSFVNPNCKSEKKVESNKTKTKNHFNENQLRAENTLENFQ